MKKLILLSVVFAAFGASAARSSKKCGADLRAGARDVEEFVRVRRDLEMYSHLQFYGERLNNSAENPVIVILHGAMANSQAYDGLTAELLERGRDVLRIDLPGHGKTLQKSGVVESDFKLTASYIVQILERYGIQHAVIYGHSMGAGPALTSAIEFKRRGGNVTSLLLDDPLVLPLEDYYYEHQEEMLSSKIATVFDKVGKWQMIGGLCLGPLGIPLFSVGACNYAAAKVTNLATALFSEIALPISKKMYRTLLLKKVAKNNPVYFVDGKMPASYEDMVDGAMAAFDPRDLREVAPYLGDTKVAILLGYRNLAIPLKLMDEYVTKFENARIYRYPESDLGDSRPHLHPQDVPELVAQTIDRLK